MPQFLRPDSNVTQTSWTNGFAQIDEATASDADFSYGANNSSTARLEVSLSNPASTPGSGTCTVRWRYAKVSSGTLSGTGGTVTQTCGVYEGTSLLSSSTVTTSGSWTAGSFTFNTSLVSDWTNLRLRFTQSGSGGGGNARGSAVSWAELEAPDAAYSLTADAGTFNETGISASLLHYAVLIAAVVSFTLSGNAATITKASNKVLVAEKATYSLTGVDADLRNTVVLSAEKGTFSEVGKDAGILHAAKLVVSTGSFTLVGNVIDIHYVAGNDFNVDPGHFTLTGNDAGIRRNVTLSAAPGSYTISGSNASFSKTFNLVASPRAFNVTGRAASLLYSGATAEARLFYYQIHDIESGLGSAQVNSGQLVYYINNYLRVL